MRSPRSTSPCRWETQIGIAAQSTRTTERILRSNRSSRYATAPPRTEWRPTPILTRRTDTRGSLFWHNKPASPKQLPLRKIDRDPWVTVSNSSRGSPGSCSSRRAPIFLPRSCRPRLTRRVVVCSDTTHRRAVGRITAEPQKALRRRFCSYLRTSNRPGLWTSGKKYRTISTLMAVCRGGDGTGGKSWPEASNQHCRSGSIRANIQWRN